MACQDKAEWLPTEMIETQKEQQAKSIQGSLTLRIL